METTNGSGAPGVSEPPRIYVTAFTIYYMVCHLSISYVADDFIYLLWTALFLVSYTLLAGGTSAFAATVFVDLIYNKDNQK